MIALAIGLSALFGVGLGLGLGRYFCKWHHKDDEANFSDCCKPLTIGEQIGLEGQNGGCGGIEGQEGQNGPQGQNGGCHNCDCK